MKAHTDSVAEENLHHFKLNCRDPLPVKGVSKIKRAIRRKDRHEWNQKLKSF